jgi:preprotein translocase subunit SecG
MLRTILTVVQVLSAISIVGLVLLQRGKGADAGAGFGAGASGTVFGARGATTGLSRMTAVLAVIFMINSLFLTYSFRRDATAAPSSLLDRVPTQTAPAPQPAAPVIDPNAVPVVPAQPEPAPAPAGTP